MAIGVSYEAAGTLSLAVGKLGQNAQDWIDKHPGLIRLSALQQDQRIGRLVGRYENQVTKDLAADLRSRPFQHEFELACRPPHGSC